MKTSCTQCGGIIEYDAASAGLEIVCPLCNQTTRLTPSAAGPPPLPAPVVSVPRKKSSTWIIVVVIAASLMVFVFVFGLLAAIAIPNFIKARASAQRSACVANIRMMQGAKQVWAVEQKKEAADRPSDADLFGPGLPMKQKPVCPGGGEYSLNNLDQMPGCSVSTHEIRED